MTPGQHDSLYFSPSSRLPSGKCTQSAIKNILIFCVRPTQGKELTATLKNRANIPTWCVCSNTGDNQPGCPALSAPLTLPSPAADTGSAVLWLCLSFQALEGCMSAILLHVGVVIGFCWAKKCEWGHVGCHGGGSSTRCILCRLLCSVLRVPGTNTMVQSAQLTCSGHEHAWEALFSHTTEMVGLFLVTVRPRLLG